MHYPIIVVGAGAGGLVLAIGAAKAGKKVLLIEKGLYGGDCTNFGCIPSKTLIAAAEKGLSSEKAFAKVHTLVEEIRSEEESDTLKKLGVTCVSAAASFVDEKTLLAGGVSYTFGRLYLATGSKPVEPKLSIPYYTNETIFDLEKAPEALAILGGGVIGCELASAFAHLGTKVSLYQKSSRLLPQEEPEASLLIQKVLEKQGVQVQTATEHSPKEGAVLAAIGRRPTLEPLNLDAGGIRYTPKGIKTDSYGRTSNKRVFAIGDCTGKTPFTHMAEAGARKLLWNLLVPRLFWKKLPTEAPRVTYTDPEVASFGLTEAEAKAKGYRIATYFLPFDRLDRARAADCTDGFVKIITKKWSSKILGATICAPRAGEMLLELIVARDAKIPLRKLADVIHPYPTYSLAIRKCADLWLTQTILGEIGRWFGKNSSPHSS